MDHPLGQKVVAYPGGEERIGFVLSGPNEDGKHAIQIGDKVEPLAYREPANYDEHGPGGTFRLL